MRDQLYTGQTWNITFDTADAAGGALGFSTTIEAADFDVYKNLGTTQRTSTAGFTVSEDFDAIVGAHALAIGLGDDTDAGFYSLAADLDVLFSPDETVDGQTVVKWIARGTLESAFKYAVREYAQADLLAHIVVNATGNTTGLIYLGDFVPATAPDDAYKGEVFKVKYEGGVFDQTAIYVRCTGYTKATKLAAVEMLKGGGMPEPLAAGDKFWRVAQHTATVNGAALPTATQMTGVSDNTATLITTIGTAGAGLTAASQSLATLLTGSKAELGSLPSATASILDKMAFAFMVLMNAIDNNGTIQTVHKDDGTVLGTAPVGETVGNVNRGKYS